MDGRSVRTKPLVQQTLRSRNGTIVTHDALEHLPKLRMLGVRIHSLTLPELLVIVLAATTTCRPTSVLYVNLHCLNLSFHDARYRAILNSASLVYCDGTGVKLASRLLRRPIVQRMTGADWIHDLCRMAEQEDRSLFMLGSSKEWVELAATALCTRYSNLRVVGTAGGFDVTSTTIAAINAAKPDILLVGMGTPRQEKWIEKHRDQLDVPVVWAVGALFDFVAGKIPRGPQFLTNHGFEWACRLIVEPSKLWRRYLIGNPQFFWRLLRYRSDVPGS